MTLEELWQAALAELEIDISRANFKTWFKQTYIFEQQENTVVIGCPNTFTKSWLKNKYHKRIQMSLRRITDTPVLEVMYEVVSGEQKHQSFLQAVKQVDAVSSVNHPQSTPPTPTPSPHVNPAHGDNLVAPAPHTEPPVIRKLHVDSIQTAPRVREDGLNPKHTFSSYVTGKANELARAACYAVAERPGDVYNPLFLYGGVGLGKTHLMQAVGNEIVRNAGANPPRILYVSCEKFTDDFIRAVKSGRAEGFKRKYRDVDVLLIDDIQFLSGKEGTQDEFFHTFNHLHQADKQIIITSDRPPKAIASLEERLLSRFEWGMIADIGLPDIETRAAILQRKAQERGYKLDSKIVLLIAETIESNVRELEGTLNKIVAHHQLSGNTPTIESVRELLESALKAPKRGGLTPKKIVIAICKYFDVASEDLIGVSRKKELVAPRQIAMFLMREELNHSFPNIGDELGGRDHTTIMHGYTKVREQLKTNERLESDLTTIREQLYQELE